MVVGSAGARLELVRGHGGCPPASSHLTLTSSRPPDRSLKAVYSAMLVPILVRSTLAGCSASHTTSLLASATSRFAARPTSLSMHSSVDRLPRMGGTVRQLSLLSSRRRTSAREVIGRSWTGSRTISGSKPRAREPRPSDGWSLGGGGGGAGWWRREPLVRTFHRSLGQRLAPVLNSYLVDLRPNCGQRIRVPGLALR